MLAPKTSRREENFRYPFLGDTLDVHGFETNAAF